MCMISDIYNYANDNTGVVSWKSTEEVCLKLNNLTQDMLAWFKYNNCYVGKSHLRWFSMI